MSTTPTDVLIAYPARYCAAWSQRDLAVALAVVSAEVHWVDPLLPEPFTGQEGATGFFQGAWQGFPDLAFELLGEPLVDAANNRVSAGAPISGNAFNVVGSDTWEVGNDGRAVSVHAHYDTLTLLRAIGLA
jgi:hypothetical protein